MLSRFVELNLDLENVRPNAVYPSSRGHTPTPRKTEKSTTQTHLRVACFLVVVLCGYLFNRLVAIGRLPSDARRVWLGADAAVDLVPMCMFSVALAWLSRVVETERLASVFASATRAGVLACVFLATGPVFAGFGSIPSWSVLSVSSSTDVTLPASLITTLVLVGLVAFVLLAHTVRGVRDAGFLGTYVATQTAVLLLFVLSYVVANAAYGSHDGDRKRQFMIPHFHHFYIGFLVASFAQSPGWASDVLLAVGLGLFAQGIGSYGFAPMVAPKTCALATMADIASIVNGTFVTQFGNPFLAHCFTVVEIVF